MQNSTRTHRQPNTQIKKLTNNDNKTQTHQPTITHKRTNEYEMTNKQTTKQPHTNNQPFNQSNDQTKTHMQATRYNYNPKQYNTCPIHNTVHHTLRFDWVGKTHQ